MNVWLRRASTLIAGVVIGVMAPAYAGTLDVSWTAPTTNVDGSGLTDLAGYRVYYGTADSPCPGPTFMEVPSPTASPGPGETVQSTLGGLAAGTVYSVSVTALDSQGDESPCPASVSAAARGSLSVSPVAMEFGTVPVGGFADRTFTVQNATATPMSGAASMPAGPFTVRAGSPFTLAPGAAGEVVVRFSPTVAAEARANLTVTTASGDLAASTLVGTGAGDTTPPTITLTSRSRTGSTLRLMGQASDEGGVTRVQWTNGRGASGMATGTTRWSAPRIPLARGTNVIVVTAFDAAGNAANITLRITR